MTNLFFIRSKKKVSGNLFISRIPDYACIFHGGPGGHCVCVGGVALRKGDTSAFPPALNKRVRATRWAHAVKRLPQASLDLHWISTHKCTDLMPTCCATGCPAPPILAPSIWGALLATRFPRKFVHHSSGACQWLEGRGHRLDVIQVREACSQIMTNSQSCGAKNIIVISSIF